MDPMAHEHDPYAALRLRDYRHLLAGGVLASIGAEMQAVTVGWELWKREHDEAYLGYTGAALFVPVLLLALPAGHVADRFNRKFVFQAAQATAALSSLGLAALSLLDGPVPLIFVCLMLAGAARAFNAPARTALLPQVVPLDLLANAVTWNSSGWQLANITGPALGGFVIAITGRVVESYGVSAACALCCVLILIPVRPRPIERRAEPRSLTSLLEGVRFVWRTGLLLAAITLDLFAVLLGGATALLPIFATDILHVDAVGLGWLRAAPAIGALVMALLLAHRPPLRRSGRTLLLAVTGFGLATIGFGLSEWFPLSFVLLALTGALDNISVVVRGTLMQTLTPDAMRGRVGAVNSVFIVSSNELGAFESGMTAKWFGTVASVVGGGIGTIVVVLLTAFRSPKLRHLGQLDRIREEVQVDGERKC
jgi:MFS family permease